MVYLVLCISGSGGGNGGPYGSYFNLQSYVNNDKYKIVSVETAPMSISLNVEILMDIIDKNKSCYEGVIIIGWSLGGAVALQTAHFANKYIKQNIVCGLILLAPSYKHMQLIDMINIPIIFIHGINDNITPYSEIQKLYDGYKGEKYIHFLENNGHDFNPDIVKIIAIYL